MSVERYFNEVTKMTDVDGYGAACKATVQALLEADNGIFTIAQTDSDTDSNYSVWLQVYDTDIYLKIYHGTTQIKHELYRGINGTRLQNSNVSSFISGSAGHYYRATVSKLGDFMFAVSLGSDNNTTGAYITFGRFVSDYDKEEYYRVNASTSSIGLAGYSGCDAATSGQTVRVSDGHVAYYSASSIGTSYPDIGKASKAPYILVPVEWMLYNTNDGLWLGHIKWGGKYDLYELKTPSGNYTTIPTANYVIDGVTYKGVFTRLIIPVECP